MTRIMVMGKAKIRPLNLTLSATECKARLLEILRDLQEREGTVRVTKHGRVVAELRSRVRRFRPVTNAWKGRVQIVGDLDDFDTSKEWNALK